ncbi:MAG TPA: metal-dependent hydrolase [Flavobacteriales bacterium]|nr:metal-dependent hydrolase [Flavobacteriales bacterium]
MDSVSQFVLGAACGQAAAGKQLGNKALLWGGIGGTIPDLDVFVAPFFDNVTALLVHRGYTHSMFFSFVVGPILASILYRFNKKATWWQWFWLFFLALITHPVLDCFTGYGTPLFLPFSDYRIDINSIFIIDPVYTLIFIVCLMMVLRSKDHSVRTRWNNRGLFLSTAYLLFTLVNQSIHTSYFREELDKQHISYIDSWSAPTALNQILYYNITVAKDGYYYGYHSWFDAKPTQFTFYPKNDSLLPARLHKARDIRKLKYFSKGLYCFEVKNKELFFCDVRFGRIDVFTEEPSDWIFKWKIEFDGSTEGLHLEKGDWSTSRFKALGGLWRRIKGN